MLSDQRQRHHGKGGVEIGLLLGRPLFIVEIQRNHSENNISRDAGAVKWGAIAPSPNPTLRVSGAIACMTSISYSRLKYLRTRYHSCTIMQRVAEYRCTRTAQVVLYTTLLKAECVRGPASDRGLA